MTREEALENHLKMLHNSIDMGYKSHQTEGNRAKINIDKIYDDFESRTCENCKHCSKRMQSENDKKIGLINCLYMDTWFHYSFGCNNFERKTDED